MAELIAFFNANAELIPHYPKWLYFTGLAVVLIVTQLLKQPIKLLTDKIPNENLRKKVNIVIMFIPMGVGIATSAVISLFGLEFSWQGGIVWGTLSQVIYEFIVKLFHRIKNGEDITADTITEVITEVKNEQQAAINEATETVQEVVSAVVQGTAEKSAEDKFNELVEQMRQGK